MRVTPALLIPSLEEREANTHFLGRKKVEDVDYNAVGFSMTLGPAISMYFEKGINPLRRGERVFPGCDLVVYQFNDYETRDNVPCNRSFNVYLNGDINLEREIRSLKVNVTLVDAGRDVKQIVSAHSPPPATRADLEVALSRGDYQTSRWITG